MIVLEVTDMSCSHCVNAITKAVKAVDKDATVRIDLDTRRVEIMPGIGGHGAGAGGSGNEDSRALLEAIREAGYTPARVS